MSEEGKRKIGSIRLGIIVLFLLDSACVGCEARQATDPLGPHERLEPLELAITVDDLPAHGNVPPGMSRLEIATATIAALKAADAPAVYGFSKGDPLQWDPTGRDVFKAWGTAGYLLGNHTYSHLDLSHVPVEEFIADIEKMDHVLASLSAGASGLKMFRYPYLSEGETLEKRNRVRDYLKRQGYYIAEVTVDYADWAWTDAYTRCVVRNDEQTTRWLREHVVKAARRQLLHAQKLAKLLLGRDIKHILLLHLGAFNTVALPDVLTAFKAEGVRFISLQAALTDPVYNIDPNLPMPDGSDFLEQLVTMKKVEDLYAEDLYDVYKIQKLEKLCVQ